MKKRIVSLLLCLCLAVGLLPAGALAAPVSYVALGDSITTGYGLGEGEKAFPQLLAEANGLDLTDLAEDGLTGAELSAALQTDKELQQAVAGADIITVTIGGNDLMNALYQGLAEAYNQFASTALTPQQVQQMLATGQMTPSQMATLLTSVEWVLASQEFSAAVADMGKALAGIAGTLRQLNPEGKLAVACQYNPYGHLENTLTQPMVDAFEVALMVVNAQMKEAFALLGESGYVDVYTPFAQAEENPCNARFNSMTDFNLDFHPNAYGHQLIAQAMAGALCLKAPGEEEEEEPGFPDVPEEEWYAEAVAYVSEKGMMNGMPDGRFAPGDFLTRAEVAQILYNLEGKPAVAGAATFTDLPDQWYQDPIAWAQETGVVDGYEGNVFRPNRDVTREEFAQMMYNYAAYKKYDLTAVGDLSQFPDGDKVGEWALPAMAWANGNGLINGHDDGTLAPGGDTTRAEAAGILMRFDQNLVQK